MRRIKAKDTGPEMLVRQAAHSLGFRYKLHDTVLPGKPDLVFPSKRAIIFVHGCFWHAHDCKKGRRVPASNNEYWQEKRIRNQARDSAAQAELLERGWRVLTIWECETKDADLLKTRIKAFLDPTEATQAEVEKIIAMSAVSELDPAESDPAIKALRASLQAVATACDSVRVTLETPDDLLVEILRARLIKAGSVEAWCERIEELNGPNIAPRRLRKYVIEHLIFGSMRMDPRIRDALVLEDERLGR